MDKNLGNLGSKLDTLIIQNSELLNKTGLTAEQVIKMLVERNTDILTLMRKIYEEKFEVHSVPEYKLMRGSQMFWTRMLENNISNKVLHIEEPTAVTHIYRCNDDYDLIVPADVPAGGGYPATLIQIVVNGVSMSNRNFDVAMLPRNAQYALELPVPLYLNEGDRIEIVGADGNLPNLRIALQGFLLGRDLSDWEQIIKPYIMTEYLIATAITSDIYKPLVVPTWMNLCLNKTWSFNRIQPSDAPGQAAFFGYGYADYDIPVNSPADGDISGNATLNVEFYRGQSGRRFIWQDEPTANWCGTREWPRPMHNLYPDARTSMSLRGPHYLMANNGGGTPETYRWWFGMGKYEIAHRKAE